MRIPAQISLGIEEFVGGAVTVPISMVTNGIFLQRSDGAYYTTQRPSVDIGLDASAEGISNAQGRGIFYWSANSADYWVNKNKVYKGAYSQEVSEATVTVTDIDGDGTTATATATAHGYVTGDLITISGAADSIFNGEHTITKTGANTFTYPAATSSVNDSGSAVRGLGGGGTERVYFFEVGDYLVILDPEDNKGWYIAVGASTVLVEITDTDFPPKQGTPLQLAKGGVSLNGVLYVMDTKGQIANSGTEDPVNWAALDVITAEVEKDGGIALAPHMNHIAAFGNRTIEFFYDNANPTASPLAPRLDIFHEIGMADEHTLWGDQNVLFFVAQSKTGGLSVQMMQGFMPQDITGPDLDTFLTSSVYTDGRCLMGSGFSTGHTIYYVLTVFYLDTVVMSQESFVYNTATSTWTRFELMHTGIDDMPVVDWTVATATRVGKGILSNGDIVSIADDWSPYDSTGGVLGVFEDGVFEDNIFTNASPGTGEVISMEMILGYKDQDTVNEKYMSSVRMVGRKTKASQDLLVQWSDEDNDSYNAGKNLKTNIPGMRINRLGNYRQRNFKLTYAGTEPIEIDGLEVELKAGNY